MPRKAPPNACRGTWASVRTRAYSPGCSVARRTACHGPICATTLTTTSGKTNRIPKTAIAMPQVRKRLRHSGVVCLRTVALTTALSNDSDISSTLSTATRKTVRPAPASVPL